MPIILLPRYTHETKVKVNLYTFSVFVLPSIESIKTKCVFQKHITWKDEDK